MFLSCLAIQHFVFKKNVKNESKERIVINIHELNAITMSSVYSLLLQLNIIAVVQKCLFISIIDVSIFFYQ